MLAVIASGVGAVAAFRSSCDLTTLRPVEIGQNSFVFAANGSLLGSIPAERNRTPVLLWRVSPWMRKATVAIEDHRFYQHGGVDYEGIARAAWKDLSAGHVVQGGSTITQQLVRNLYISKERTFKRKVKEACLAIKLSRAKSKDWILAQYMNQVYFGNHAYGIEAAAQTYFSRHAKELTLDQAALLAGLPQAPTSYDPLHRPAAALARRDSVLEAMFRYGDITADQYREAIAQRNLRLKPGKLYTRIREPYFFSYVRDQLIAEYGSNTVRSGGLRVYTTINPRLQLAATKAIKDTLYLRDDPASAVVSINPANGAIRAMTAVTPGRTGNQFNLVAQARRQPGSTFKVFVLTAAIEMGMNPNSTYYVSAPFHYQPDPYTAAWDVSTYGHDYSGSISVTNATLASDNTVYAQLTLDVGPDKVAEMAHRLGIQSTLDVVPAMGLGSDAISPLEEASAYATLAAGGIYSKPMAIRKVDPRQRQGRHRRRVGHAAAAARDLRRGRLRGDEDPRGQRARRHRRRRLLRPARRGQDRHHREPRRRLVLGLRAAARDDGLGRLPAGRDPDGERARGFGPGRHLPGNDLAPVHGSRDGECPGARLAPAAEPRDLAAVHAGAVRVEPLAPTPSSAPVRRPRLRRPPPPHARRRPRRRRRRRLRERSCLHPRRRRIRFRPRRRPRLRRLRPRHHRCRSVRVALRAAAVATPIYLAGCAVPDGGLFRAARFRDLHIYQGYAERLLHGELPYRDVFVEYPPGAFAVFLPPTAFGSGHYNAAFKCLMALCGVATLVLVALVLAELGASRRRLYAAVGLFALSPVALGPISLNTYDAWPALLTVLALWLFLRERDVLGFAVLGLAITAKVYPLVLVPLACIFVWRRAGPRRVAIGLGALLLVAAAVVAPFAAYAPHGVFESFRSQAERGLQVESLGASFLLLLDRLGALRRAGRDDDRRGRAEPRRRRSRCDRRS